ncbi:MAG: FeoA family protein [candidate division WOR-3 bacterium]|jgi:ferrous iron transport protein A
MPKKNLTEMQGGETGQVVAVHGGHGFRRRLEALGIRPGMKITKKSSQIMRGPVIVKAAGAEIAIGFGMARHILVEI